MFYSDTFPQIVQSLWLSKGKMLSGFAIGHSGQRRVPLLVYVCVCVCVCVYIYIYIYTYEGHLESKERSRIQPAQLFQCS
jgi:hypothetical protein